jgi:HD-GYP domain-containing protein (c-di-GMP phosphodiesterase class II)
MRNFLATEFSHAGNAHIVSQAHVLGALSYALDLTEGQPAGHSIRACWIAMRLGRAIGLSEMDLRDLYYTVLLKDLGCSSNAARVAQMFAGNDRRLKHDFKLIGPAPEDFGAFIVAEAGAQATQMEGGRSAIVDHLLANAGPIMVGLIDTRCTRGADIARQLRFSEGVAAAIAGLDEHWDGSGLPHGVAGEAIPLGSRIALLAQVADVFFMALGGEAARQEVALRSGSWIDPVLADAFLSLSTEQDFWTALTSASLAFNLAALEPEHQRVSIDEAYLDDIATAFGQVIDAKSPYTGGHSERVGTIADAVAAKLGCDETTRRALARSAMLHDVGKLGVSSRILEKPGALDDGEWTEMRHHASLTTDILSRVGAFCDMAMIAGSHHERLDGKGYPLGLDASMIALETRIITVADFFDALTADRPYRAAMSIEQALDIMADELGTALDPKCFAALKAAVANGIPQKPLVQVGPSLG